MAGTVQLSGVASFLDAVQMSSLQAAIATSLNAGAPTAPFSAQCVRISVVAPPPPPPPPPGGRRRLSAAAPASASSTTTFGFVAYTNDAVAASNAAITSDELQAALGGGGSERLLTVANVALSPPQPPPQQPAAPGAPNASAPPSSSRIDGVVVGASVGASVCGCLLLACLAMWCLARRRGSARSAAFSAAKSPSQLIPTMLLSGEGGRLSTATRSAGLLSAELPAKTRRADGVFRVSHGI